MFLRCLVVVLVAVGCSLGVLADDPIFHPTDEYYCSREVPTLGTLLWTSFGENMIRIRFVSKGKGWAGVGFNQAKQMNMLGAPLVIGYNVVEDGVSRSCVTHWLGTSVGGHPTYNFSRSGVWNGAVEQGASINVSFAISLKTQPTALSIIDSTLLLAYSDTAPSECPAGPNSMQKHVNKIALPHRWDQWQGACCSTFGCPDLPNSGGSPDSSQVTNPPSATCPSALLPFSSTNKACIASEAYTNAMNKLVVCRELRCTCIGGVTIAADTCSFEPGCTNLNCQRKKYLCDVAALRELSSNPSCQPEATARASLRCEQYMCEIEGCVDENYSDACDDSSAWKSILSLSSLLIMFAVMVLM
eukprot:PhF_6_TR29113/c0_g1_i1/m.42482